ncbi:MAG: phosphoenolpyruvate--protein phosphotransferase [Spirochaetales bacterium]|nr:phosphoenolpyruvate--protein phosphotransferase [Spirochaetales bacterium]
MGEKRDDIDLIVSASELASVFDKKSSLKNFLQDITEMVASHMSADVCSIYLYNESRDELVLKATVGLSPSSIDNVRLKPGEGITGIALKELRPVCEASATKNPSFRHFQGIDEELYEAFLAVPIKRGIKRIGVITLQHRKPGYFSKRDTSALKAIASQLAASIVSSQMLMNLGQKASKKEKIKSLIIKGAGEGSSAVRGKAYILNRESHSSSIAYNSLSSEEEINSCPDPDDVDVSCIELDLAAFDKALEMSMRQLESLQSGIDDSLTDVAGMIFTAHFLMLRDDNFTGEMRLLIKEGIKPDEAVRKITDRYAEIFKASDLPGIQEKIQDIKDLEHRLLANLYGKTSVSADYSSNVIIADNVFPSELVKIWLQNAKGLILYGSGITAHITILAHSLALPLLSTTDSRIFSIQENSDILMDCGSGSVYITPSEEVLERYDTVVDSSKTENFDIPAKSFTVDGVHLKIQANINIIHDVHTATNYKAEGIGLYRSEFPFLIRDEFPSEEVQYRIYRTILEKNGDAECVFRTLDIGGDKIPGHTNTKTEANPFLGFRGIRFSLAHVDVFQDQLKAMLRAGVGKKLKIMFPMVSSLDEFLAAKEVVNTCMNSLVQDNVEGIEPPEIGVMIELPSAVEIIEELSSEADFFSIGTNDLIMYTLAVDRTNEYVKDMYRPYHPAVLKVMKRIADQALKSNTEVSVCGEAASEPLFFSFLAGLGIRKFSTAPQKVPSLKSFSSRLTISDCEEFSKNALASKTVDQAEAVFNSFKTVLLSKGIL